MSSLSQLVIKTLLPPFRPNEEGSFNEVDEEELSQLRPWQRVHVTRIFLETNPNFLTTHAKDQESVEIAEEFFSQWKIPQKVYRKWIKHVKELESKHRAREGSKLPLASTRRGVQF
jgi:hypothetical protein